MKKADRFYLAVFILLLYVGFAEIAFRFRHPQMTETELFLHTGDALLWRKVK